MLQQNTHESAIQVLSPPDNSGLLQANMLNERARLAEENNVGSMDAGDPLSTAN